MKGGSSTRHRVKYIEVLRYTVFWRIFFLNDGGSLTRNRVKYIQVLGYTVFWLKWFLNERRLLNPKSCEIHGGIKVYRFLANFFSE